MPSHLDSWKRDCHILGAVVDRDIWACVRKSGQQRKSSSKMVTPKSTVHAIALHRLEDLKGWRAVECKPRGDSYRPHEDMKLRKDTHTHTKTR